MLNYYGKDFTPDTLNAVYKEKGVFSTNLINFYKAADVFPDLIADEFYQCRTTPCDLSKIDKCLQERKPVIAHVDLVDNDKKPDHFVIIIGKTDDGHYIINDPYTGETYFFDAKYGDPAKEIYGLRIYSGVPPQNGQSLEDENADLRLSLESTNEMLATKALELSTLQSEIQNQKNKVSDIQEALNATRDERDQAIWDKKQMEIKNKELEESVESLKKKNTKLNEKLEKMREGLHECPISELIHDIIRRILRR